MIGLKNKCENCKWLGTDKKCRLTGCVNLSDKNDTNLQTFIVNELLVFENEKLKETVKEQNDFIDAIYARLANYRSNKK